MLQLQRRWAKLPAKRQRWLKRIGIAFAVYTVLGFVIAPMIVKWQLRKQLTTLTHRAARVEAVRFNPYALSLTIRGLSLKEPDGSTFGSFSNLYVNFEAAGSLLNSAWTFKQIQLVSPYGYFAILTNGQLNFANLLTTTQSTNATASTQSNQAPTVLVKSLAITNGMIAVADFYRDTPFQTKFTPINVRLTNFTNRPRTGSPYMFHASTDEGEFFRWAGSLTAVPPSSAGRFELGGIDLKKYGTYLREFFQFDVRGGKVTVGARYRFALRGNGIDLMATNASVALTNLQIFASAPKGRAASNLVSIPSLAVRGASANLRARAALVESVETFGGYISARRFRDGVLDLLAGATPPANRGPSILNPPLTTTNKVQSVPAAPWSVSVQNIALKDYTVRATDQQTLTPMDVVADQLTFTLHGFSNASNAPVEANLSARVNGGGTVKIEAKGTLLPLALESDFDVQTVALPPFQPYIEQQAKLALTSGSVSAKGHASLALTGTNTPAAKFTGDVMLSDVVVMDQIAFQDLARWKQLEARGLNVALAPLSVKATSLTCNELVASVVIGTNGQLALAVLSAKTNAAANPTAAPTAGIATNDATSGLPFPLSVDIVALVNTSIRYADLSLNPPCRFALEDLSGVAEGLSSAPGSVAKMEFNGRVNEGAPFRIFGKVNPLVPDMLLDLVISNHNTELTAFTPYMEKFAGYPLQKGKLSMRLKYSLQQKALQAENRIIIDKLTLGQRNQSPEATKLPVKLGVALLKDREGRIVLDIPVKGRLDDPKFAVGPIIGQVVMNLLTKAASSPFSMLGALVGGGEELSSIEFAPGQAAILEAESAKIEKLGRALYVRPTLGLDILGSADEVSDKPALAWLKLERELKSMRMAELVGKSGAPTSAEEIKLERREYPRLLRANYKQKFNRNRPLSAEANAAATPTRTATSPGKRPEVRKGAETPILREVEAPAPKPAAALDARAITRPASLPALDPDDKVLLQIESELLTSMNIGEDELRDLIRQRSLSVQRALLQTQKVEGERLFILAPKEADAAFKGQTRVNLSLN